MATRTTARTGREVYRHANWTPGFVSIRSPSDMKPGEAEVANNVDLSDDNGVRPRAGYTAWSTGAGLSSTFPVVGLFCTGTPNNNNANMLAVVGTNLVSINNLGVASNLSTNLYGFTTQVGVSAIAANLNGATYVAAVSAGLISGVLPSNATPLTSSLFKITDPPGNVLSNSSSPTAACVAAYQNALWVANYNSSTPNRLFWSGTVGASGCDTWPAANFLDVGAGDFDAIMALVPHGNQLLIIKENSIWRLTGSPPDDANISAGSMTLVPLPSSDGCMAPQTAQHRNGVTYWLGQNGLFSFDGTHFREESVQFRATLLADVAGFVTNQLSIPGFGISGLWTSNHTYLLNLGPASRAYQIGTFPAFNVSQWDWTGLSSHTPYSIGLLLQNVHPPMVLYGLNNAGGIAKLAPANSGDLGFGFNWTFRTGVLPIGPSTTLKLTRFCYTRGSSPVTSGATITLRPDLGLSNPVSATYTPTGSGPIEQTNRLVLPLVARTIQLEVSGLAGVLSTPTTIFEVNIDFTQRPVP